MAVDTDPAGGTPRPPYPLTRLEQRALAQGEWVLVHNAADQRVYFFNPKTRRATRHLQPLLLRSDTGPAIPPSTLSDVPTSAVLPAHEPTHDELVASLQAKLRASEAERLAATTLAERLQREVLLLRYASLANKTKHCEPRPSSSWGNFSSPLPVTDGTTLSLLHGTPRRALCAATAAADLLISSIDCPSHSPLTLSSKMTSQPDGLSAGVVAAGEDGVHRGESKDSAERDALRQAVAALQKQVEVITGIHMELLTRVRMH